MTRRRRIPITIDGLGIGQGDPITRTYLRTWFRPDFETGPLVACVPSGDPTLEPQCSPTIAGKYKSWLSNPSESYIQLSEDMTQWINLNQLFALHRYAKGMLTLLDRYGVNDLTQLPPEILQHIPYGGIYQSHSGTLLDLVVDFVTSPAFLLLIGGVYAVAAAPAAGAAGAAATAGTTASVSGAELVALVEAGTVGVEGAFLEAAALTGSSVVFDTATGALISAISPSGTAVVFDAALDPFAQFGIEPSAEIIAEAASLPPEIPSELGAEWESAVAESAAQDATLEALGALPPESASIVQDVMQQLGIETLMQDAGNAVVQQLTQMGQAAVASEVQQLIGGKTPSGAAPGSVRAAQELPSGAALPSSTGASRLTKTAVPLILGGGLGWLLMLVFADRN